MSILPWICILFFLGCNAQPIEDKTNHILDLCESRSTDDCIRILAQLGSDYFRIISHLATCPISTTTESPSTTTQSPSSKSSSILVITGAGDTTLSPEVINLEGKTCSRLPEKYPKNVYGATGGFINGQVIICGGYDYDTGENINECYTLKKGSGSWTPLANLHEKRSRSSSVVIENSLYIIGGACGSIESISLNGVTKQHEPGYPHCIAYHSSVAINKTTSITIGGGIDEFQDKTYYYNGKEFSKGPDLITGRYSHAAGLLRDKVTNDEYIAVVGGKDSNYNYLNSLELLKIGDNKWKSGNPLPKPLRNHAIVSIGGDIIVIGGWDDNDRQSALYKLECKNGDCQWTTLPQTLKFARFAMVAMAIPDDFFDCN